MTWHGAQAMLWETGKVTVAETLLPGNTDLITPAGHQGAVSWDMVVTVKPHSGPAGLGGVLPFHPSLSPSTLRQTQESNEEQDSPDLSPQL
jgi:hypothetical protein